MLRRSARGSRLATAVGQVAKTAVVESARDHAAVRADRRDAVND
ncbi:hypothetical protein ACWFR5_22885 [Streptomyces sp. NPDC055092]